MNIISCILILLVLTLGINGESYDDYDYEDNDQCEASDNCAYYSSMDESCACHHRQFPRETLEERYGEKVQKCCNFHGYRYHLYDCEVHKSTS